jgi:TusA-related sulfurtransferase
MAVINRSDLTCPECGHSESLEMPDNPCIFFHKCAECKTLLRPKEGDCCVFCSYGDVACPPIQAGDDCCSPTSADETPVRRLDLLGFFCPIPVHETRKAMAEMEIGQVIEVVGDDPETLHDMPALCERIEAKLLSVTEDAGEYTFRIRK